MTTSQQPFSIDEAIQFLIDNRKYIGQENILKLQKLSCGTSTDPGLSTPLPGSVDFLEELQQQLGLVKAMRKRLDLESADPKLIKDLISTSTSLFSMMTKLNDDIMNQDRIRKIENATIAALKSLPEKAQELFYAEMMNSLS